MTESTTSGGDDSDLGSETPLETLQYSLEWNCNETNNNHCRIVTELDEDDHGHWLRVWPRTDDRGEYVKATGYDSVLRQIYRFEAEHEVLVTDVDPDSSRVLVRDIRRDEGDDDTGVNPNLTDEQRRSPGIDDWVAARDIH